MPPSNALFNVLLMLILPLPSRLSVALFGGLSMALFFGQANHAGLQAQCVDHPWALAGQGSERDEAHGIGVDSAGNAYLAGWFDSDQLDFGGGIVAVNSSIGQNGNGDAFLVKIAPDGTPLWARSAGGNQNSDWCWASATAPSGRSAIAGQFYSTTMAFGVDTSLSLSGLSTAFVAVYESDGSLAWARAFGSTGSNSAFGVAFGPDGAVHATGDFEGTLAFGDSSITSQGSDDLWLAVWNADGSERWARSMGGSGYVGGNSVAVAPDGMVYVSGRSFSSTVSFAGGVENNAGLSDLLILAYGPDGSEQHWFYGPGSNGDEIRALAVDADGRVYAAGAFISTDLDVGGTSLASNGVWDLLLLRFTPELNPVWVRHGGGTGSDHGYGLSIDPAGHAVLSGLAGNAAFVLGGTSVSQQGVLHAGYDSTGALLWAESHGGNFPQFDQANAVACAPNGDLQLAVKFQSGDIDFGGGTVLLSGGGFANSEVGTVRRRSPLGLRLGPPPANEDLCAGASVSLSVSVLEPVPDSLSYAWQLDGVPLPGATGPELFLSDLDTGQAGSYTCLVGWACGSVLSGPTTIAVRPQPPAPLLAMTTAGDSLQAIGPGDVFVWTLDGTLLPFSGAVVPLSGSGAYTATAILSGCPGPPSIPLLVSGLDLSAAQAWSLHPQPAADVLHLQGLSAGTWTLRLSNLEGRVLASTILDANGGSIRWVLPRLPAGSYLLQGSSETGSEHERIATLVLLSGR